MQVVCYFGKAARQGKVAPPSDNLLADCEAFAKRNQLTGLLAISDGYFLHFLEGEEAAVQSMVARIAAFWDQESPTILFENRALERQYQEWSVAIAHGAKQRAEAAQRLETTKLFLEEDPGDAGDAFRYFLTPNRAPKLPQKVRQVRQVAIFSNSVLWFNPIFSHLSERFGTQACALKVSSTGKDADSYPLDYADVTGDSAGPIRVVGISEGLLGSTLSQPLLENIELMVFLMRRSGQGTDTEFVARALKHQIVQRCKPRVLFVTPGGNTDLSDMLHKMVSQAGLQSTETRGSVLMGGPTWKAIHEQLVSLSKSTFNRGKPAQEAEPPAEEPTPAIAAQALEVIKTAANKAASKPATAKAAKPAKGPATAVQPQPVTVPEPDSRPAPLDISLDDESLLATPEASTPEIAEIAEIAEVPEVVEPAADERLEGLSFAALKDMLDRLMYGMSATTWLAWIDLKAHKVLAQAGQAPRAESVAVIAENAAQDFDNLAKRGESLREMVTTFNEYHEIMVPHPLDPTLALYVLAKLDDLPLATLRRLILDDLAD